MAVPGMEERRVVVLREVCAAAMLLVLVGLAGAVLSVDQVGMAVLTAVVAGLIAARMTEHRSQVALAAVAVAVFVLFCGHRFGAPGWPYSLVIGFAVMLGGGYRFLRQAEQRPDPR